MTPELQHALDGLKDLITNPVVYNALILIAIGLIPKQVLDKLPLLGNLIVLVKTLIATQQAKQEAKKVDAASVIADAAVQGYEQLKTQKKIDSPSAAAEATALIVKQTGVDERIAKIIVERAVRDMNRQQDSGVSVLRASGLN